MELSKKETNIIKGLAALFLVYLHLFNTMDYSDIQSIWVIKNIPVEYYISFITNSCVSIYLFCSGYGLSIVNKSKLLCLKENLIRVMKILVNYWIILIIFVILGYLLGDNNYPGSIKEFLMNFFLLSASYNGAWWFLQTYVILLMISPYIIKFANKSKTTIILITSGILYFIGFIESTKGIIPVGDNIIVLTIYRMIVNFLNCQFGFILGTIFVKEGIITKIRNKFQNEKYKQITVYILIIFTFSINILTKNWVIAPITCTLIIIIFSLISLNNNIERFLNYISTHSTNIWLTHMFFYSRFFENLVYAPKYSILIFIWLILICISVSYIINFIYKWVIIKIEYKLYGKSINRAVS